MTLSPVRPLPRRHAPLRERRPAAFMAPLAAGLAALAGLINVVSALTPELAGRLHDVHALAPATEIVLARQLALPVGVALLLAAPYLALRRRGALAMAVSLLLALGVLDLVKGLDFEEAIISWALAAVLLRWRAAFWVRHDAGHATLAARRIALIGAGALAGGCLVLSIGVPWEVRPLGGPSGTVRDVAQLLSLHGSAVGYDGPAAWVPRCVQLIGVLALILALWAAFRRPASPASGDCRREEVARIVREHGSCTLSFFKLRSDLEHLFSADRRAVLSYRVEGGVLLVAGDPVGPAEQIPGLLAQACAQAEHAGLRVGVVGASEGFAGIAAEAGLRAMYIGDEAVVETADFSLEGRRIKKVRQAVMRVERHGYTAELRRHASLSPHELRELERVSASWRDGAPERGFSMAMDSLQGPHLADSWMVIGRDEAGVVRGFLHFVPTYGRPAASLSFMRRERETPNGVIDFLVVRSIDLLRDQGIEEISLNFAAFARLLRSPAGVFERLLARVVTLGNPFFQIESLYRFNRKFHPRWEPRYLLYEGRLGLARAGIAALLAEGQMPLVAPREPDSIAA
jgi:lysyl-tRNA synthetase class 2